MYFMKLRESGMPEESCWESLFDVELALDRLGIDRSLQDVVELGCGYGTFTIPVARRISGGHRFCFLHEKRHAAGVPLSSL